jgi:hypothetical protein
MESTPSIRLAQYLNDSLEIIKINLTAYRNGCRPCYRVLAAQLRILLCDQKHEHGRWQSRALAAAVLPGLTLHPCLAISNPTPDTTKNPIPLIDWLRQILLLPSGKQQSIAECIKWVCEKDGGAHVDIHGDDTISDQPYLEDGIIAISEYLITRLNEVSERKNS